MGDYDLSESERAAQLHTIQGTPTARGAPDDPGRGHASGIPAPSSKSTPLTFAPREQTARQASGGSPRPVFAGRGTFHSGVIEAEPIGYQRGATVTVDPTLLDPFRGMDGARRVDSVRRSLAAAVITWWTTSELPGKGLVRDGLLALEAGHALDEAQRTLLARSALAYGRGSITAMRHLGDPERMASLLHEAVLAGVVQPADLERLLREDLYEGRWKAFLVEDLRADLASQEPTQLERVRAALAVLTGQREDDVAASLRTLDDRSTGHVWLRTLIAGSLLVALAAIFLSRFSFTGFGDVVLVPAGSYALTDENGNPFQADLSPFVIDRTEVTNAAYRQCADQGACPWPQSNASESQDDYFVAPAFALHPVANVTWEDAIAFCRWRGKRLPTMGEWEVAARYAPATQRNYAWPWGDHFEPAFVIAGPRVEGPAAVASRSPQGDSPLGAADMAGNVAEWTGSTVSGKPGWAWIKGGWYRDVPQNLVGTNAQPQDKNDTKPWLGFRCAAGN